MTQTPEIDCRKHLDALVKSHDKDDRNAVYCRENQKELHCLILGDLLKNYGLFTQQDSKQSLGQLCT